MDIKEFTQQALLQIVEGAKEANAELERVNAYIPYTNIGNTKEPYSIDDEQTARKIINVDFDVAITATETEGSNGGGGLKVAGFFSVGGNAENKVENQTISRVKYTLPLVLAKKR